MTDSDRDAAGDAAIIDEVLEGNVNAFESLLERYQSHVAAVVARHMPPERIQEAAHETFVRAYRSLGTYGGKKLFKHWLSGVAVRCCYDLWREHYRRREVPVSTISREERTWVEDVASGLSEKEFLENVQRREAAELLGWAMDRLSAGERTVLSLIHFEGYSTAEAAELLGWSLSNVKVRSFRARRKLRKLLSTLIEDGRKGRG